MKQKKYWLEKRKNKKKAAKMPLFFVEFVKFSY